MKYCLNIILIYLLIIFTSGSVYAGDVKLCGPSDYIVFGGYSFHNDVYGASNINDAINNYKQCTTILDNNGSLNFKTEWSYKLKSNGIKAYPHMNYGWDWVGSSYGGLLPGVVSSIDELKSNFHYKMTTNSKYNVSYDIWISDKKIPEIKDIKAELMVWVENSGLTEILGNKYKIVNIDGVNYKVYYRNPSNKKNKWIYIAFVVDKEKIGSSSINIKSFINYISEIGLISSSDYVNNISFGAEILDGVGLFSIESFSVEGLLR